MKSNVDAIGLQGIEFWSTVCDEEQDLAIEVQEVGEGGREGGREGERERERERERYREI